MFGISVRDARDLTKFTWLWAEGGQNISSFASRVEENSRLAGTHVLRGVAWLLLQGPMREYLSLISSTHLNFPAQSESRRQAFLNVEASCV